MLGIRSHRGLLAVLFGTALLGSGLYPSSVSGVPVVFTLNSSASQLTASGSLFGNPFTAQGPGALTTSYAGTINADLTAGGLQFTGGSLIAALTNGAWQPVPGAVPGSSPADYGATNNAGLGPGPSSVPGNFALRNILLDMTSLPLTTTNGSFDGSSVILDLVTNAASLDYYYSSTTTATNYGSYFWNGSAANTISPGASVSTNAGVRKLVLPINVTFLFSHLVHYDTIIHLIGQLVATNAPPVIQSIVEVSPNVVLTTLNTSAQSTLLVSTNLTSWATASATISTNNVGQIVFTTPISGGNAFYRIQP